MLSVYDRFFVSSVFAILMILPGSFGAEMSGDLYPVQVNGLYGFIRADGSMAIEPQFGACPAFTFDTHFSEGLEPIEKDGRTGYIDMTGRFVIEPAFSQAGVFSEGFAVVRTTGPESGYINHSGELVIPPKFHQAMPFSEGLAQVIVDNRMGYIDTTGEFVIEPRFTSSSHWSNFSENLACVRINEHWGYIDRKGHIVIEPRYNTATSFSEGLAAVSEEESGPAGYIDHTGKTIIAPQFTLAWPFSEGLARVQVDGGGMAFIDTSGKEVFRIPGGRWAGTYSCGLVNVEVETSSRTTKWGYWDKTGNMVIEPVYDQARPFVSGVARVMRGRETGYIDRSGNMIREFRSGNEQLLKTMQERNSSTDQPRVRARILNLARAVDPDHPPVTEQMLKTGDIRERVIQKLRLRGSCDGMNLLRALAEYRMDPAAGAMMPEMTAMQEMEIHSRVYAALAELGDPAIVPEMRKWVFDALPELGSANQLLALNAASKLRTALQALSLYEDAEMLPVARDLYRESKDKQDPYRALHVIADYLVSVAIPENRDTLRTIMNDPELTEHIRFRAAGSLVKLNDTGGLTFFLAMYDEYLASLDQPKHQHQQVRNELERCSNTAVIAALEQTLGATPEGRAKRNIETLLELMRINTSPKETLKKQATDTAMESLGRRLHAIQRLGESGGIPDIPFLESQFSTAADLEQSVHRQSLESIIRRAISQIRRRHWSTIADPCPIGDD